jgi:SAM-dependent methyltransferase
MSSETIGGSLEAHGAGRHRDDEYDSKHLAILQDMQARHFWYRGRHRFLLAAVQRQLGRLASPAAPRLIDLGGGCGGWVAYLAARKRFSVAELALADSSGVALQKAANVLPSGTAIYHVDLLDLPWTDRWEVAFLLDVLEHVPAQEAALRQINRALAPGGLLFITAPALKVFWSWNDEAVHHVRRYAKADFGRLATASGFRLMNTRYFMFFLSPLLWTARLVVRPKIKTLSKEELEALLAKMHEVPGTFVNALLAFVFCCETPIGHYLSFPWGTSVLAILQKPIEY